jgi:hypothetical protein
VHKATGALVRLIALTALLAGCESQDSRASVSTLVPVPVEKLVRWKADFPAAQIIKLSTPAGDFSVPKIPYFATYLAPAPSDPPQVWFAIPLAPTGPNQATGAPGSPGVTIEARLGAQETLEPWPEHFAGVTLKPASLEVGRQGRIPVLSTDMACKTPTKARADYTEVHWAAHGHKSSMACSRDAYINGRPGVLLSCQGRAELETGGLYFIARAHAPTGCAIPLSQIMGAVMSAPSVVETLRAK